MSLQTRIEDLVVAIATDIKQLRVWLTGSASGDLTGLVTTDKTSIVAAINEVKSSSAGAPPAASTITAGVVELADLTEVATGTDTTRAVTAAGVRQERLALRDEILGGAGAAYDTLQELHTALANDEGTITSLTNMVGQKIDSTAIGNPETDLVAEYTAAKA